MEAVHQPEATPGAPGKELAYLSSQQSVWRERAGVEEGDEEAMDDVSGESEKEGTPVPRHSCRSGGNGCCARGGCPPLEVLHQTHSSSDLGC